MNEPWKTVKRFDDCDDEEAPKAVITRAGRWKYNIVIKIWIGEYGPAIGGVVVGWTVYGRTRAEKLARRKLWYYLNVVMGEVEQLEITE